MQLCQLRESEDFIQLPLLIPMSTIVPRGIFYRSYLYKILNGSSQDVDGTPLDGMNVMGNENNGSINSNTIQLILYRNSTWTQAEKILSYLLKNESGNLSYTYLDVTNEMYTIGFNQDVLNITPNMIVFNSGNGTAPKKPEDDPSFWEVVWNSFCGFVSYTWNVITAAANYMVNLFKAAMEWGIGLVKAIANGSALEYIQETIVKPFVDALLAFIQWVIDLVTAAIQWLFEPLINSISSLIEGYKLNLIAAFQEGMREMRETDGNPSVATIEKITEALTGNLFYVLLGTAIVIMIIGTMLTPYLSVVSALIGIAAGLVLTLVLNQALGTSQPEDSAPRPSVPGTVIGFPTAVDIARSFIENEHGSPDDLGWALLKFVFGFQSAKWTGALIAAIEDPTGKAIAMLAFVIASLSTAVALGADLAGLNILAAAAIVLAIGSIAASIAGLVYRFQGDVAILTVVASLFGLTAIALGWVNL